MKRRLLLLLVAVLCGGISTGVSAQVDSATRSAASRWTAMNRGDVFDIVAPPATSIAVADPECRLTTLRSPGSLDSFGFAITVREWCDGHFTGQLVMAEGKPLDMQLYELLQKQPDLTPTVAAQLVRLTRRELSEANARDVVRTIAGVCLQPLPPHGVVLDSRRYEIESNTGFTTFAAEIVEGETDGGRKHAVRALRKLRAVLKLPDSALDYVIPRNE